MVPDTRMLLEGYSPPRMEVKSAAAVGEGWGRSARAARAAATLGDLVPISTRVWTVSPQFVVSVSIFKKEFHGIFTWLSKRQRKNLSSIPSPLGHLPSEKELWLDAKDA